MRLRYVPGGPHRKVSCVRENKITKKLFLSSCANFPTIDFMARRAFGNSVDPGAQQEKASNFFRAQKQADQIDQQ